MPERLQNRWWRLNNLYQIQDKQGRKVQFNLNWAQRAMYSSMWYLNMILKARQLGITTFIDIFMLDSCLFNSNTSAAIIAQTVPDVGKIFEAKIRFPYINLPAAIREQIPASTDRANEYYFANGSSIRVATSVRSATLQYLHVSEFGHICARYPDKAKEIVTGSLNTVEQGNFVFIESTAQGQEGYFFEMCQDSMTLKETGNPLTPLDYKFWFFPWHLHPDYILMDASVTIGSKDEEYFDELENVHGIILNYPQKAWYIKKKLILGDAMKSEYPSIPEEAFEASITGSYFHTEMGQVRKDGRITKVPYDSAKKVDTWWDLGMNDTTCIVFTQDIGREVHIIDYYENQGEGIAHYVDVLRKKEYRYGRHTAPHDIMVRELGTGKSRRETAREHGIDFDVCPKMDDKRDSIQAARNKLAVCWFDESKCDILIKHLTHYRKEWDDIRGTYKDRPFHDKHSHGADAFQTFSIGHDFKRTGAAKTVKSKRFKEYFYA